MPRTVKCGLIQATNHAPVDAPVGWAYMHVAPVTWLYGPS